MDAIEAEKIGIIILAAGASKRLGRPKQLLKFEKKTLLERIAENALATGLRTVVVLGASAERIEKSIEQPVEFIINQDWQSGMSSTIASGLKYLLEVQKDLQAIVVLLCDQPFIDKNIIFKLIETQIKTGKKIVAGKYAKTVGVPALFTKEIFDELLNLSEENGAKSIIKKYWQNGNLTTVSVPEAEFDIDTEEDFERLKNEISTANDSEQV